MVSLEESFDQIFLCDDYGYINECQVMIITGDIVSLGRCSHRWMGSIVSGKSGNVTDIRRELGSGLEIGDSISSPISKQSSDSSFESMLLPCMVDLNNRQTVHAADKIVLF